jgi:uncharacterized membrane protein YuzA (DUF378 family)
MDLDTQMVVWLLAEVGALNWGLREAFNINLVTELLGTGNAGIAYIVIGVAGAAALAEKAGVLDLTEL